MGAEERVVHAASRAVTAEYPRRRAALSALPILGASMLLAAGLCYLIEVQAPGRPVLLVLVAVVVVGLGALADAAVVTGRQAADRRLRAELREASSTIQSIEALGDPRLVSEEVDGLLATVLDRTMGAVGADLVALLLADQDASELRVRACAGETHLAPIGATAPLGEGALGMAVSQAGPLVVLDVAARDAPALPEWQRGVSSLAVTPLVHGATRGVLEAASLRGRRFGAADLGLLQVAADHLAALVERERLVGVATRGRLGARHANLHLRVLARAGTVLGKALEDYGSALDALADVVVPDFADWFGIDVMEDAGSGRVRRVVTRSRPETLGHELPRPGHPHPKGEELALEAMTRRRAQVLVPTARFGAGATLDAVVHTPQTLGECPGVTSMLVVPLEVRGAPISCLTFVTGPGRRGYRPSDLEMATELAERAAVAIERVLTWRRAQRAERTARRYAGRLRRLVDAALVVNARRSEPEVLQLLVEHAQRALGADVAVVSGLPGGGPLVERAWPSDRAAHLADDLDDDLSGVLLGACDLVVRSGGTVRSPGSRGDGGPRDASGAGGAAAGHAAVPEQRGWIAAPLTDATDGVRRVVVVAGRRGTRYSAEDESVLTLLAQMASVALRNVTLYAGILREEQRLQALVDAAPLAIAELDPTGEARWWNQAATELFGWHDGSTPRRIPVQGGSELVLAGVLESASRGKPVSGVAMPVVGADGTPLELSISSSPLGSPDAAGGLLVVAEDVTERQRIFEEFHRAERLNAMSRMAGALAHDFNNLLTVILGCSDVLVRRLGEDEELGPDVAAIQRAGTRAASLTGQLLRIGGQQHAVEPELVAIDEAIAGMQPMLAGVLGKDVRLEITAGAGQAGVLIDRSELERFVLNLAINARDAMPSGGTFTVQTRAGLRGPGGAELVELSFVDTGTGMDEDTAAHCFEPFFTTKGRARGTGLGLAAVHAMVTQAGGDVRLETSPGEGTRFTITLPVAEAEAASPLEPELAGGAGAPPRRVGTGRAQTLLVVDDEPDVLRLEMRELRSAGYDVLGATDASEALQLLASHAGTIDLVVTDVVMPGMNGIELAAAIRRRHREVAILFVSGHLDENAAAQGSLPEQADLLMKPFGPEELTRRVGESLDAARRAGLLQGSKR